MEAPTSPNPEEDSSMQEEAVAVSAAQICQLLKDKINDLVQLLWHKYDQYEALEESDRNTNEMIEILRKLEEVLQGTDEQLTEEDRRLKNIDSKLAEQIQ